ncbi:protein Flattop [Harpegnathos saltator]|uniref:protein Flattop n=1 Tax=Harpegnathos saltator TaxID=610380 RepID=UPI000948E011|nr:protein Flattop [Harpegnathos saltator]
MSQHWHGHWTEDAFTAKRLRNWEVPKWHPSRPDRHCATTKFIANDNGHILDDAKKAKYSPWGIYKTTWDLPKRITRSMAEELSATPQYEKEAWGLHNKKHENLCKKMKQAMKKTKTRKDMESPTETVKRDQIDEIQESQQAQGSDSEKDSCVNAEKNEESRQNI